MFRDLNNPPGDERPGGFFIGELMARINIEDEWWTDPRRYDLADKTGDILFADGAMLAAWRLSQEFWKRDKRLVPEFEFVKLPSWDLILEVGLAEKVGSNFYIKGSKKHHDWILERVRASAKGGKSNANRAKQTGSQTDSQTGSQTGSPLISGLLSPSNKNNTTTGLSDNINQAWKEWNITLNRLGIPDKNISPFDERILAQAIKTLGLARVVNAIIGKRHEKKSGSYDPSTTVSLEYCLSRNSTSGKSNHERLENLALHVASKNDNQVGEE